jgi:hypothetical protein
MKNRVYGTLILFCSLIACQKTTTPFPVSQPAAPEGFKEYIIPKGDHSALSSNYKVVNKPTMRFMALFDSSCIYTLADTKNATDINKLYGFSDCGSLHHENSARIGWVWNGRAFDLYAYCYADSVPSNKWLGVVAIGIPVELAIRAENKQYILEMNGTTVASMKRSCTAAGISGYQLYPYFGGDETAPQDVHIYIKDL